MIFSIEQLFSDKQAITATARSTNVIDLGAPGTPFDAAAALHQDVGKGTPVPILVQVTEDFDNATSLTIAVEVGASDALGTVVLEETILLADLVEGRQTSFQVLPIHLTGQFLGLRYTVNGTNPANGAVTAGITMGNQTNVTGA